MSAGGRHRHACHQKPPEHEHHGPLALDLDGELVELDLNPLLVRPKGRGAVALDALAVPGRGASARQ
ncbi:hypothetical protein [Rhabdothermincola sediminis]|uniref:hypothetical protein n=1 Tax=Rhabdothermincola sediminis TaxID=2751370 RepID=UPI001AA0AE7B|nr:hypothetical protein [Rhabdothermincola sediminis]